MPFSIIFHRSAVARIDRVRGSRDKRSRATSDENHYSVGAIESVVLAAMTAEATINEAAEFLASHTGRVPDDFSKLPLQTKWFLLPLVAGAKTTFERGCRPWQDFVALADIRNALVHSKVAARPPKHAINVLQNRGCLLSATDWTAAVLTLKSACWAVDTTIEMLHALTGFVTPVLDAEELRPHWICGAQPFFESRSIAPVTPTDPSRSGDE